MFIRRDLLWLEGYPKAQKTWISVPFGSRPVETILNPQVLSRSVRTINMLLREFPRVLPKVVGDTAAWAQRLRALIEIAKPHVHHGAQLPLSPVSLHPSATTNFKRRCEQFGQADEAQRQISWVFQWIYWTDLDELDTAVSWLAENRCAIEQLLRHIDSDPIVAIVRLHQLTREHGARRLTPLIRFLNEIEHWQYASECPSTYIDDLWKQLQNQPQDPAARKKRRKRPLQAKLPTLFVEWAAWLCEQNATTQKRGLELFEVLVPDTKPEAWMNWWQTLQRTFAEADVPKPKGKQRRQKEERKQSRKALEEHLSQMPPIVPSQTLRQLLFELPLAPHKKLYEAIRRAAKKWPEHREGTAFRLAFAAHWFELGRYASANERGQLIRLIELLTDYAVGFDFDDDRLQPWRGVWKRFQSPGHRSQIIDDDLVYDFKSAKSLSRYFALLAQVDAPTVKQSRFLSLLCQALPTDHVLGVYEALCKTDLVDDYISDGAMRLAFSIAGNRPKFLRRLLRVFEDGHTQYEPIAPAIKLIRQTFERGGLSDVLVSEFEEGEPTQMISTAVQAAFILSRKHDLPGLPALDSNSQDELHERYPVDFHEALSALSRVDRRATETAERLLHKDFPAPEELESQLETLRQLARPTENQLKRMETLKRRVAEPSSVSPARRRKLLNKIEKSTRRIAFDEWKSALRDKTRWVLVDDLGLEGELAAVDEERLMEALLSVAQLNPSFQRLARQLLQVRAGPEPWDLRDAPANQAFLEKMEQRGLRMEPWLDNQPTQAELKDGKTLTLVLETDPLEVFQMGRHFNTCLSPGSFNYFSVFANAADINKKVLFARDANNRVWGRMLIAITDEGGLLPFHAYAHSGGTMFRDVAQGFVQELADAMGTLVISTGTVAQLVADDWYDDGPIDLMRRHAALDDGSAFRKRLQHVSEDNFLDEARSAMAPLPLNELTLPMLLALPEIEARPNLALQLLPAAKKTQLPLHSVTRLGRIVMNATPPAEAKGLGRWIYNSTVEVREGFWGATVEAVELLNTLDPVRSLRLLRQTRPSYVRRWKDDRDGRRLMLCAQANEQLHRRRKAYAFYELALSVYLEPKARRACQKAMNRLSPSLD